MFLNNNKPLIVGMAQHDNMADTICLIKDSIFAGADAMGIQLEDLKPEFMNEECLTNIFNALDGKPCYITNYRHYYGDGKTDEQLAEGLIMALNCGGTLADVMGDMFDRTPGELTMNSEAIKKQMELIDNIHKMGKEVLMSTHIQKFTPAEEVLRIALEHQKRGADISKIVTGAETEEEQVENLRITTLLKKELDIPFLFLSGGKYNIIHRLIGPMMGSSMWLCVHHHYPGSTYEQPLIENAKKIRDSF